MPRYRLPRFRRYREGAVAKAAPPALAPSAVPAVSAAANGHGFHVVSPYNQGPPRIAYDDLYYEALLHGEEDAALVEGIYRPQPEDFLPSPPKPIGPLDRRPAPGDVRPALFCFVLFWVVSLYDWGEARQDGLWASGDRVFRHHENWRLLTALFAHADIGHLLSNSPLFIIFGWYLYAFFGPWVFPGAALLVGILSNLATVYYYEPNNQLLGASGMVYGMVALWLVLYMHFETNLRIPVRFMRALAVSLLLLFPTTFEPSTSYMAHAAGFSIGLAVGLLLLPLTKVRLA